MTSRPDSARAVVIHAINDLRVDNVDVPTPADDQALVAIAYGGICGSDLHYWTLGAAGESILTAPMTLGHEVSGTVLVAAQDGSGPEVGTNVAVHPGTPGAGNGSRYPHERPNLSPGSSYLGSAARTPHTDGAFASLVALPTRMLRKLPGTVSLRTGAIIEPASVAWHAVSRAGDVSGKRVLVIGCGPIGTLAIAVLRRAGAREIVAVDVFEKALDTARKVGATATLLAAEAEAVAAVDADIVIESSGSHHGLTSAIHGATRGGRVVMVGLLPSGPQPVMISLAITRELELFGSFRFNSEIDDVIAALADGSLNVDGVITDEFPVEKAVEAFTLAKDSSLSGKVLLRF